MTWLVAIAAVLLAMLGALVAANRLGMARLRSKARRRASVPGAFGGAQCDAARDLITLTPAGVPADAPAVLFVHAWGVPDPAAYQTLIDHLLRRGFRVRFPLYQRGFFPHPIAPRLTAILSARAPTWRSDTPIMIGHSAGGTALVDVLLGEASLVTDDVFMASAADGNGPDGKPLGSSLALLQWGQVANPVPPERRRLPRIHVVGNPQDPIAGTYTSNAIADFLERAGWGDRVERIAIPDEIDCATHFWPTGGNVQYRLSPATRRFAYTDAYGGVAPGRVTEAHRFFLRLIDQAIDRRVAAEDQQLRRALLLPGRSGHA